MGERNALALKFKNGSDPGAQGSVPMIDQVAHG